MKTDLITSSLRFMLAGSSVRVHPPVCPRLLHTRSVTTEARSMRLRGRAILLARTNTLSVQARFLVPPPHMRHDCERSDFSQCYSPASRIAPDHGNRIERGWSAT